MIIPYLYFQESCRAAMLFYQEVLGGDLQLVEFADMQDGPEHWQASDLVMHATLNSARHGILMASDFPPDEPGEAQQAVSITLQLDDPSEGRALFDVLSQGGEVFLDYGETFFAAGFGTCRDMFGTHWMINVAREEP